jgi:hypothetical protein
VTGHRDRSDGPVREHGVQRIRIDHSMRERHDSENAASRCWNVVLHSVALGLGAADHDKVGTRSRGDEGDEEAVNTAAA